MSPTKTKGRIKFKIKCPIQCVYETKTQDGNRRLVFLSIIDTETGYNWTYGIAEIPKMFKGIAIVEKFDDNRMPKIYGITSDNQPYYAGRLRRQPIEKYYNYRTEFLITYCYSKNQNSDDLPNWLKKLAKENNSAVAYFEF